nr:MAG TPA: KilAC domain protein [Bacteriophage sp.]
MNELIKVDADAQIVSARELHEALGVEKRFSAWFETNSQGFVEGEDFTGAYLKVQSNQYGGEKEIQDYNLSVDMAKHICLMSRTDKGKACRQYLIDVEKAWNTPEQVMARALKIANQTIDSLKENNIRLIEANERMKPKEIFADAVATSKTSILVGDLAKLICQNGYQIGQKRLFDWLRNNGYLVKSGSSYNMPMQRYVEQGLFEVKESNVQNPDGSVRTTRTTKVTGKGQVYFVNKFLGRGE